jgi:TP901 family phage tail tape measure protein
VARKGTLTVRIVGDARGFQQTLQGVTGSLGKFAKRAAMFSATAIVGGIAASTRAFANFDEAMTQSLAIMGDVSDVMRKDMSDAARQVAKTTQFSAKEAADSYFFLASAGLDAEASIAALPQVAKFAQAGMFDMARATDLLTDAQSALGLASENAETNLRNLTRVGDVLVGANTLANASVEQFSEALTNKAGAALRLLNKDVEEGVAVLAAFADQGVKGAGAGESLNIIFRDLQRAALKNEDAFRKANIAVFNAEGNMRNIADVIGDLEGRLDGMSDAQVRAELTTLGFQDRSISNLLTLMGTSDAIRQYEKDLRGMAGVTDEVAGKQLETFNQQLGLLKDQFIDLGISIGERIMPALSRFVEFIQDRMPAIESVVDSIGNAFGALFGATRDEAEDTSRSYVDAIGENILLTDRWALETREASEEIGGWLGRIVNVMENTVEPAFRDFHNWWKEEGDDIKASAKALGDGIQAGLVPIVEAVGAVVRWFASLDTQWQKTIGTLAIFFPVAKKVGGGLAAIAKWLSPLAKGTALVGVVFAKAGVVIGVAAGAIVGWFLLLRRNWRMFKAAFDRDIPILIGWFQRLPEQIQDALRNLPAMMLQVGKDIVGGLILGITGSAGGLLTTVRKEITDRLPKFIKDRFDISSPSKLFAKLGRSLPEGLAAGIEDGQAISDKAFAAMLNVPAVGKITATPQGRFGASRDSGRLTIEVPVYLDGQKIGNSTAVYEGIRKQASTTGKRNATVPL